MKSHDVIKYKPTTPSTRQRIQVNYINLLSGTIPFKFLLKGLNKKGGRNHYGRLTAFRKGGGHSKRYRILSTKTQKKFLPYSVVHSIEYDPFRSAFVCCCFLKETGSFQYILAPQNIKIGTFLSSNYGLRRPNNGSASLLFYTNIGDTLYNINLNNGPNSYSVATSAGTFCKVVKKEIQHFFSIIQLPSGGFRSVSLASLGFLGKTSNPNHKFEIIGKAGRSRWLGQRPSTRGSAQNPIDHPHGGGEGKSSSGRPSVTPWGWITKGQPTRRKKKDLYILKT